MQTYQYNIPATENSTLTIPLPEEFRGAELKIVLEKECQPQPPQQTKKHSMSDFLRKYTGILKDCDIESVEAMKEDRINYLLKKFQ